MVRHDKTLHTLFLAADKKRKKTRQNGSQAYRFVSVPNTKWLVVHIYLIGTYLGLLDTNKMMLVKTRVILLAFLLGFLAEMAIVQKQ